LLAFSYRRSRELDVTVSQKGEGMRNWKKFVIGAAAVLMLGAGATMVAQASGRGSSGVVDISGPCDEAEHANDPRCAGVTVPAGANDELRFNFDISGPCDEAEHANDPRYTGVGADDGNSGRGRGNDGDREDNSGPSENSGPGNADDDDNSGRGRGDDEGSHDNSGPGGEDD
jgi:hypothetical protein